MSPLTHLASSIAWANGTIPVWMLSPRKGCSVVADFMPCHSLMTVARVSSSILTAPPSSTMKPSGSSRRRFTRRSANLSAAGLISSITSSARDGLPGRSVCRNPTYGSSPDASRAERTSLVSIEYRKERSALKRSLGGLRVLSCMKNAALFWRMSASSAPKYTFAASPSMPRSSDADVADAACDMLSFNLPMAAAIASASTRSGWLLRPFLSTALQLTIFPRTMLDDIARDLHGSSAMRYCSRRRRTLPRVSPLTDARNLPLGLMNVIVTPFSAHRRIAEGLPPELPKQTTCCMLWIGTRPASFPATSTTMFVPSLRTYESGLVTYSVFSSCLIALPPYVSCSPTRCGPNRHRACTG